MSENAKELFESTLPLTLTYRGKTINLQVLEEVASSTLDKIIKVKDEGLLTPMAEAVSEAIRSWDLHWNGAEFLPTAENLIKVCGFKFVVACAEQIISLISGNPTKEPGSPNS